MNKLNIRTSLSPNLINHLPSHLPSHNKSSSIERQISTQDNDVVNERDDPISLTISPLKVIDIDDKMR